MLPRTLALVDDDTDFREYLAQHLREHGVEVTAFDDSDSLLADRNAYDFGFYVLDLMLPGIDGVDMTRVIRRRSNAGILVISGRLTPEAFDSVLQVGADMYLAKPVRFEQAVIAIKAIHRRIVSTKLVAGWVIDRRANQLIAPDEVRIELSPSDLVVIDTFLDARGEIVAREVLRERLKLPGTGDSDNALHATIYRLRRRIERATTSQFPLQSVSRTGYVFRAALSAT